MSEVYADQQIVIEALIGLGRMGNNSYIVRPASSEGGVTIVDVPEGFEAVLEALGETPVERVVVTHSHRDHWAGWDVMRSRITAPVYCGAAETNLEESRGILPLADGDTFAVGEARVQVLHTPGHTPGSICLLANRALLTGDTLFPGGPGHTRSHEALTQLIDSITTRLHTLKDDTVVLPGHGAGTTIGASREEYAGFAARSHAADLHGDVLWAES